MIKEKPDLILLNVGMAEHHADWNYKNVNSPFARIYLVREGQAWLHLYDRVIELTPGHLYIIPPFTLHSYECYNYFSLYYIHIYENENSTHRILEDLAFPVELKACQLDCLLVEHLFKINPNRELKAYDPKTYDNSSTLIKNINIHSQSPPHITIDTQGILLVLFSRFLKDATIKSEITDSRIRKIVRYMRKHINDPVNMDDLTEICCLSKDHFIRLFRKEMGTTPINYINQKKIEKAQLMIITGNLPIKDIAYSLSFENISYFNRLFKRYTGTIPSHYGTVHQLED